MLQFGVLGPLIVERAGHGLAVPSRERFSVP